MDMTCYCCRGIEMLVSCLRVVMLFWCFVLYFGLMYKSSRISVQGCVAVVASVLCTPPPTPHPHFICCLPVRVNGGGGGGGGERRQQLDAQINVLYFCPCHSCFYAMKVSRRCIIRCHTSRSVHQKCTIQMAAVACAGDCGQCVRLRGASPIFCPAERRVTMPGLQRQRMGSCSMICVAWPN